MLHVCLMSSIEFVNTWSYGWQLNTQINFNLRQYISLFRVYNYHCRKYWFTHVSDWKLKHKFYRFTYDFMDCDVYKCKRTVLNCLKILKMSLIIHFLLKVRSAAFCMFPSPDTPKGEIPILCPKYREKGNIVLLNLVSHSSVIISPCSAVFWSP